MATREIYRSLRPLSYRPIYTHAQIQMKPSCKQTEASLLFADVSGINSHLSRSLARPSMHKPLNWLTDWLIDWSIARSIEWSIDWFRIHGVEREARTTRRQWIRGRVAAPERLLLSAARYMYSPRTCGDRPRLPSTRYAFRFIGACRLIGTGPLCSQGGDVLKFAGDAVIVMFSTENDTLSKATRRCARRSMDLCSDEAAV